jgi:hypothetical protein
VELSELNELITELALFYERKEPKNQTIELWFKMVKKIPSEPIKWMVKKIQEKHESFPKNITSALWGSYTEWQQANPDKIKQQDFWDCPDCNEGLIFAKKKKEGNNYEYVFRCVKCKQNHCRSYPLASPMELKEEGYDVIPKGGNLKSIYKPNRDLNGLLTSFTKTF